MIAKCNIFLICFCTFLCGFTVKLSSQTPQLDSLKLALKNVKNDSSRCEILSAMIEAENDDKVWVKYNDQLKTISELNMNKFTADEPMFFFYKKNLGGALNNIGYLSRNQGDIPKALEYYSKSLKIQEEIGDKS